MEYLAGKNILPPQQHTYSCIKYTYYSLGMAFEKYAKTSEGKGKKN